MKLDDFQEQANEKAEELMDLVNNNLKQNGLTATECQRTFLNQQISEVIYAIYGTQDEDMK